MTRNFLLGAALLLALSPVAAVASKLNVASFSTILTEVAQKVGGEHVVVFGLVKPGVDPHEYEPTPADMRRASEAQLILTSGRLSESYLNKLQEVSAGKATLLAVGDQLPGLAPNDIHWWNAVGNVEAATVVVRDALTKLDPADAADFARNAQAYLTSLEQLQHWVRQKVAELPRDRRTLVTAHDAFQDFASKYGFETQAIEGVDPEGEPSNRHVAELIERIKKDHVKAIFIESTLNPKVTTQITRETGARIGGVLYADGLGTGAASSYAGMIQHNVSTIVDALK